MNPNSLANLKPCKPGETHNPHGRPKKHPITDAYDRLMSELWQRVKRDPRKMTVAELIALGQVRRAIKGNTATAKEITDRIEGKAVQPVDLTADITAVTAQLPEIIREARARARRAREEEADSLPPSGEP